MGAEMEAKKRERDEQHLFLTAKVITDKTFQEHQGFDLAVFEEKNWPLSELPTFRVLKQEPYLTFKARVAQHFKLKDQQIRLWVLVNRQNKTVRPDTPIPENESALTVENVRNNLAARQTDLRLYLDILDQGVPRPLPELQAGGPLMIFLKFFNVSEQSLRGIGKTYVSRHSKVGDLAGTITALMNWVPQTPIKLYEEIKPGMIEIMKPKMTFTQSEIQDGDIICFQVELSDKEVHDLDAQGLYSTPVQFYDFMQYRVLITFKPKYEEVGRESEEFELVLSKKMNYEMMSQKVGEYLKHEPIKLRFTTANANGTPKGILKRSLNQTLADILQPTAYVNAPSTVIFYERLEVSIVELETKRSLKVVWTGVHNKEETTLTFLLPKTSMVHDLAEQISKQVTLAPTHIGSGRIRVFEISKDGRHQREFTGTEMLGNLPDVEFFAEEIPADELAADEADKVISVFHFSKEPSRTHGVPFRFVVKPQEKFLETKKRLQARIGVTDKDILKYRFALIQSAMFKQPSYIEDDDMIYDHKFLPDDVLGLDHVDRSGRAGRTGGSEKAIVIKG